ncbi:hypothetical protein [Streptomyces sp. NPDC054797]
MRIVLMVLGVLVMVLTVRVLSVSVVTLAVVVVGTAKAVEESEAPPPTRRVAIRRGARRRLRVAVMEKGSSGEIGAAEVVGG